MDSDFILIVDKPEGLTSHDVVARVRKIVKTRRVGHTGTLDPFATGVLVVCVNRATRLVRFLTGDDKEYIATMRLGFSTDTGDLTGRAIGEPADAGSISPEDVRCALARFTGRIMQVPPMYSARKIGGVKLYEMARKGLEVERKAVEVNIIELELLEAITPARPDEPVRDFSLRVVCSSGTYIRTLAEEIGRFLGPGAHLAALRRTRSGRCTIEGALTLEGLAALAASGELAGRALGMAEALEMPALTLTEDERKLVSNGRSLHRTDDWDDRAIAKLTDGGGTLLAVARYDATAGLWKPEVVLDTGDGR